jgi:hypothetical protein
MVQSVDQEAIPYPRLSFVHDKARQTGSVPLIGKRVIYGSHIGSAQENVETSPKVEGPVRGNED